jgi:myo-inositol 2-dehydrogenase/D-chiro-inositol 1-dehydrogenase/scyllo-inositol 2-dehydrogenase (NAD+)
MNEEVAMKKAVRLCLVGGGRAGKVHANSINRHIPAGQLTALVEPVEQTRAATASEFGIEHAFSSLEEAIAAVDFQAVVITTPTFTHKALSEMAAQAGKHIFLEKPMALTLEECDAIIKAVESAGVMLQLGFMRRFSPEFLAAAQRIEAGEIGQPMMIKSLTHGPGLPPAWARDMTTSNGMLAEVNSHDWDCVRWLMGANYERVYAEIAAFKGERYGIEDPHFYDNALVTLRFEGGGLGMISGVCPCEYGYDARVEIIGEKGILQVGQMQGQAVVVGIDRSQGLVTPIFRTWPERFAWAYIYEMEHFIHSIQSMTLPYVGGEAGRWAVAGVLAATRSFVEERPVYLSEIL